MIYLGFTSNINITIHKMIPRVLGLNSNIHIYTSNLTTLSYISSLHNISRASQTSPSSTYSQSYDESIHIHNENNIKGRRPQFQHKLDSPTSQLHPCINI